MNILDFPSQSEFTFCEWKYHLVEEYLDAILIKMIQAKMHNECSCEVYVYSSIIETVVEILEDKGYSISYNFTGGKNIPVYSTITIKW